MDPEAILIKECLRFNRSAQRDLYDRYAPRMRAVCYRYVKDPEEAKDILQNGFLKVFLKIHQFEGKGNLEAWIRRIIVNTAIDYYNRNKDKTFRESEAYENHPGEYCENIMGDQIDKKDFDDDFGYDLLVKADISQEEILNLIQQLPDSYRIPFNLFFLEKYSHKEISESIHLDENTSRTRVKRAREMLQKQLYELTMKKLAR